MYNENRNIDIRKMKTLKRKNFILMVLIAFVALGSIIYVGGKYIYKRSTANNISINKKSSNNTKTNLKDTIPTMDAKANLRESTVMNEAASNDPSKVNIYASDGNKVAYLTFDDGPSADITPEVLSILDKNNIKATFFIVGSMAAKNPDIVKMEAEDGQSIGNHTYSHNYQYIYSSTKTFINDINKCDTVLKSILGNNFNSKLVRFPGGSFGTKLKPYREALNNAGYHYIDWNDLTGDAEGKNIPAAKLLNNLKTYTSGKEHVVILMHDAYYKETTVQALPQVIEYLKSQGYSFETLK